MNVPGAPERLEVHKRKAHPDELHPNCFSKRMRPESEGSMGFEQ